ncbi:hypothetical protein M5W74_11805 [Paenibacillus larvae]|uniref:Kelch repeat-containing protein n=1 Tax=Paenibacillus larvae TaxID=1464 RepID=UPI00228197D5|nr:kelch repeat-containing protein [Paenibacillus larvae]MCY9679756.1 hypothetical protein [Paenibacillus larvae]
MAEKSMFFNSVNGDRRYLAEDFAGYFSKFITNGYFPNKGSNLQVDATGQEMSVIIRSGAAWINGYMYSNTSNLTLKIDVADGVLNRIDRVVLQCNFSERLIKAVVKKGQFASNPVAPELQRDADIYELGLADILVKKGATSITGAGITDLRLNTQMCGVVNSLLQADTTAIFNQFQDWFIRTSKKHEQEITSSLEEFEAFISEQKQKYSKDFEEWFSTIKDVLDENTAGHLLNLIQSNTDAIHELFTSVSDGKNKVAKAITDQGVPAVKEDPFKDLAAKIRSIDNGNIPIYVQPTEPAKKTGFWIQDEQNEIEHVVYTDVFSESGEWSSGKDMPTARSHLTSSAVGDRIYTIGGNGGKNKLEIYDTATNTWTAGADMPTARGSVTSSAVGDRIYAIGGDGYKKLEIYDTTTNTWTVGADMLTARSYLTSSAVGDRIYTIGGNGGENKLEIYDTATNTWKVGAYMPTLRSGLTSSAVGDKIYVIGGYGGRNELEIYDTTTNTWTKGADMPTARGSLTSSAVGDRIYAIGGWGGNSHLSKVEIYSITPERYPSNSWVFKNGTAKDVSIPNKTKLGIKYSQRIQFNSAYYFNKLAELVYKPIYFGNGQKWTRILN